MTEGVRAVPDELALSCSACGARTVDPLRFSCPDRVAGDDIDHVLVPPEPDQVSWPDHPGIADGTLTEQDPFRRYRQLLYPYRLHRAWGGSDASFLDLLDRLQAAVAAIDGRPFRVTPLRAFDGASLVAGRAPSVVWVKDETGNVSGSHKGRHFMGLALHLLVVDRHLGPPPGTPPPLAISSCGNAALAASVLARALRRPIEVFVPPDAAPSVLARLEELGATVRRCPRVPGRHGDPCQAAFEASVQQGAVPFSAQGPSNGLALDGAATLGYELADQLRSYRLRSSRNPDRSRGSGTTSEDRALEAAGAGGAAGAAGVDSLYVQLGGGALASSVMTGLRRAHVRGVAELPALHTVQARDAAPFTRAVDALEALGRLSGLGGADGRGVVEGSDRISPSSADPAVGALPKVLAYLARHRHQAMQPWPQIPFSVAGGILDDETYDWRSVVEALVQSGGRSVLVTEQELVEANELARRVTGIEVDCTGSAGLAGVWAEADPNRQVAESMAGRSVLVLFTGARR